MKSEDREEADAMNSDVADEEITMDSNSEMHKSGMDTKQADPVMNGIEKVDSVLANGKGELST